MLVAERQALAVGALVPIETEFEYLQESGIHFLVRVAGNLQRKSEDKLRHSPPPAPGAVTGYNPFLPPEPILTLGGIGPDHLAVLNKFNVIKHHLLIVTREFEEQERLLGLGDWLAWWRCMAECESLGFYNGGAAAGASQGHKHLQWVPLPLEAGAALSLPISPVLEGVVRVHEPGRIAALPFPHLVVGLSPGVWREPEAAAEESRDLYLKLLRQLGLPPTQKDRRVFQSAPYNLLLTRAWMLLVPRAREAAMGISVNALGFAGSLFVKNREQLAWLRREGPLALLRGVCPPV